MANDVFAYYLVPIGLRHDSGNATDIGLSCVVIRTHRSRHYAQTVTEWRKHRGWSRKTVVARIVAQYEQMGGQELAGTGFNPRSQDTYDRMRVNANSVYR